MDGGQGTKNFSGKQYLREENSFSTLVPCPSSLIKKLKYENFSAWRGTDGTRRGL